jgi:hypothetical protein
MSAHRPTDTLAPATNAATRDFLRCVKQQGLRGYPAHVPWGVFTLGICFLVSENLRQVLPVFPYLLDGRSIRRATSSILTVVSMTSWSSVQIMTFSAVLSTGFNIDDGPDLQLCGGIEGAAAMPAWVSSVSL